ncbi:MAG: DUF5683 domain-containing protein [Bacteroidota bacterium]|jgi:hypothetical protein
MKYFFLFAVWLCFNNNAICADTTRTQKSEQKKKADTPIIKIHSPSKAALMSGILPGLGQAYNKKYWKIPVVYVALGTCAGFFIYNRKEYIDARNAYRNKLDNDPSNDEQMAEKFRPVDPESIRRYRNGVRQYVDYSVLAFILCWGLNVVDAAVDAHLHSFELTENLTLHMNPYVNPQLGNAGMQLTLALGKRKNKTYNISY